MAARVRSVPELCSEQLCSFSHLRLLAADPAMFRGDPAHTGIYRTAAPAGLSTVKWKFKTGGRVISSPVLSGGLVYFGSSDQNLYAVNTF